MLGSGRPSEEVGKQSTPLALGAWPGLAPDPFKGRVDIENGKGGMRSGRGRVPQRRIPNPDLALTQLAGQEGNCYLYLVSVELTQARGQPLDLGESSSGRSDSTGGLSNLS